MLSQQTNRLTINRLRAPLANRLQRPLVRALDAEQQTGDSGPFVKVKDIRIPDDVACPRRADKDERDILGDERFEKGLPSRAGRSRILVGEIDYLYALLAMQAREVGGKLYRIAVPPCSPKIALTAVVAMMGAATGKLHHYGAAVSPIGISAMVDQFPSHPISIQIGDHRRRWGRPDLLAGNQSCLFRSPWSRDSARAKHNPGHPFQGLLPFESAYEPDRCLLPFPPHNEIDPGFLLHDLGPMEGGEYAAINDPCVWKRSPHRSYDLARNRMARGRA